MFTYDLLCLHDTTSSIVNVFWCWFGVVVILEESECIYCVSQSHEIAESKSITRRKSFEFVAIILFSQRE